MAVRIIAFSDVKHHSAPLFTKFQILDITKLHKKERKKERKNDFFELNINTLQVFISYFAVELFSNCSQTDVVGRIKGNIATLSTPEGSVSALSP